MTTATKADRLYVEALAYKAAFGGSRARRQATELVSLVAEPDDALSVFDQLTFAVRSGDEQTVEALLDRLVGEQP